MVNKINNSAAKATRAKLIEAGGQVFAERGYVHAPVREITLRARVSVAAVNYHFKGKSGLYDAVLDEMAVALLKLRPPEDLLVGSAVDQLQIFIRYLLGWLLSRDFPNWAYRLWQRETEVASPRMKPVYESAIKPFNRHLIRVLQAAAPHPLTPLNAEITAATVTGQCLHFMDVKPITDEIFSFWPTGEEGPSVETLAEHIFQCTYYGALGGRRKNRVRKRKR